jgi:hypothetical protein
VAHQSVDRPDEFLLCEHYGKEPDFIDHQAPPHFKEFVLGRAVPLLAARAPSVYNPGLTDASEIVRWPRNCVLTGTTLYNSLKSYCNLTIVGPITALEQSWSGTFSRTCLDQPAFSYTVDEPRHSWSRFLQV